MFKKLIAIVILNVFCITQIGLAAPNPQNLRQTSEGKTAEAVGSALGVPKAAIDEHAVNAAAIGGGNLKISTKMILSAILAGLIFPISNNIYTYINSHKKVEQRVERIPTVVTAPRPPVKIELEPIKETLTAVKLSALGMNGLYNTTVTEDGVLSTDELYTAGLRVHNITVREGFFNDLHLRVSEPGKISNETKKALRITITDDLGIGYLAIAGIPVIRNSDYFMNGEAKINVDGTSITVDIPLAPKFTKDRKNLVWFEKGAWWVDVDLVPNGTNEAQFVFQSSLVTVAAGATGEMQIAFKKGVVQRAEQPQDPYSPLAGTDACREAVATYLTGLWRSGGNDRIDAENVFITPDGPGQMEILIRMFADTTKSPKPIEQRDKIYISPKIAGKYGPVAKKYADLTDWAPFTGDKIFPKVMVYHPDDLVFFEALLESLNAHNSIVIVDATENAVKTEAIINTLLALPEEYRKNVFFLMDFQKHLELPGCRIGALVSFNKGINIPYMTAAGGSIAAPSGSMQAGLVEGLKASPLYKTNKATAITTVDDVSGIIAPVYEGREPDPTLRFSPFYYLYKNGIPKIFYDPRFTYLTGIKNILGASGYFDSFIKETNQNAVDAGPAGRMFERIFDNQTASSVYDKARQLLSSDGMEGARNYLKLTWENRARIELSLTEQDMVRMYTLLNIIHMHVGAPSYPRPEFVKEAIKKSMELSVEERAGLNDQLAQAEIDYIGRTYGVQYAPDEVVSGFYGSKTALQDLLLAVQATTQKELSVLIPEPYYVGYDSSIVTAGIPDDSIIKFETSRNNKFVPTPDDVKKALASCPEYTKKALLLTSPGNPTSTILTEQQIKDIANACKDEDVLIILDVAYGQLIFNGKTPNLAGIADQIAFVRTQSKEAAHPGGRLGSALVKDKAVCDYMRKNLFLEADDTAKLVQIRTYQDEASTDLDRHIAEHTAHLKNNAETIMGVFDELGIGYVKPDGGFYIVFDAKFDPWDFGITYVDGAPFHANGMTRFSYAGPAADIKEAASRLGQFYPATAASAGSPLLKFKEINQQIWLDGLTLDMLTNGYFEELVRDHGITGVTTNPTLIKAYLKDENVLDKIRALAKQGLAQEDIYYRLINELATTVIGIFKKYDVKGKFSVELDPNKAGDVAASVEEAMRWTDIDPEYMMVKVAANREGYKIIEEVTAKGKNVNATLIFTPTQYDEVAEAYIRGLEKALQAGINLSKIYSVASFFISRWDVRLYKQNPELFREVTEKFGGMFADSIAIYAYNLVFKRAFINSEGFQELQAKGARPQDFLLASTGSKAKDFPQDLQPSYPPDIYVTPVQGANVVNTLPAATIDYLKTAAIESKATIVSNLSKAVDVFQEVRGKNTIIDYEGSQLFKEGMESFIKDFNDVQSTISNIINEVQTESRAAAAATGLNPMSSGQIADIVNRIDKGKRVTLSVTQLQRITLACLYPGLKLKAAADELITQLQESGKVKFEKYSEILHKPWLNAQIDLKASELIRARQRFDNAASRNLARDIDILKVEIERLRRESDAVLAALKDVSRVKTALIIDTDRERIVALSEFLYNEYGISDIDTAASLEEAKNKKADLIINNLQGVKHLTIKELLGIQNINDIMSLPNPVFYKDEVNAKIMVWLATQA